MARNSFPYIDIWSCDDVNVFNPYAMGSQDFLTELHFSLGSSSSSDKIAYPVAV